MNWTDPAVLIQMASQLALPAIAGILIGGWRWLNGRLAKIEAAHDLHVAKDLEQHTVLLPKLVDDKVSAMEARLKVDMVQAVRLATVPLASAIENMTKEAERERQQRDRECAQRDKQHEDNQRSVQSVLEALARLGVDRSRGRVEAAE